MRPWDLAISLVLALAIVGLWLALAVTGRKRSMYDEGCVIGRIVAIEMAQKPKHPDIVVVLDNSRPQYPNQIACEIYGDKIRAQLAQVAQGDLVRVVGSIKSNRGEKGWFTHFSVFSIMPLAEVAVTQAAAQHKDISANGAPF